MKAAFETYIEIGIYGNESVSSEVSGGEPVPYTSTPIVTQNNVDLLKCPRCPYIIQNLGTIFTTISDPFTKRIRKSFTRVIRHTPPHMIFSSC